MHYPAHSASYIASHCSTLKYALVLFQIVSYTLASVAWFAASVVIHLEKSYHVEEKVCLKPHSVLFIFEFISRP